MQLVLHGGKKTLGSLCGDVVVNRRGVNVGDLLIELALREADFPYALQLLFKILLGENRAVVLQAFVIHRVALAGERLDDGVRPFAELHGALGVNLVAHCDDRGEVVVLGVVALAVGGSYPKISDN